jgi:hypothetical protein
MQIQKAHRGPSKRVGAEDAAPSKKRVVIFHSPHAFQCALYTAVPNSGSGAKYAHKDSCPNIIDV